MFKCEAFRYMYLHEAVEVEVGAAQVGHLLATPVPRMQGGLARRVRVAVVRRVVAVGPGREAFSDRQERPVAHVLRRAVLVVVLCLALLFPLPSERSRNMCSRVVESSESMRCSSPKLAVIAKLSPLSSHLYSD